MSISEAHSDAARRNGAMSNGPVSEEGRRRSSQNARKHGFFSSFASLPEHARAEIEAMIQSYTEEYQPQTPTEIHYVRELADAEWRLQQVRAHYIILQSQATLHYPGENDLEVAADAFKRLAGDGPALPLLLRYETKFQRQYDKAVQQLLSFADRRVKADNARKASNEEASLNKLELTIDQLVIAIAAQHAPPQQPPVTQAEMSAANTQPATAPKPQPDPSASPIGSFCNSPVSVNPTPSDERDRGA
ncbi:MAG: hypothetical protein HY820_32850 [Acidobacteria bacterium]|nr:hypothetical protein [Acidobacteriota bacterium]